ncbi:gamma-butyrobetaine dioxygenase-like [Anopheles cruzii]|uniref:gamma-butyrobetaine dioxygenase-like n=1 Tax=Anopheles cruzii TaxID=68878 RepID=UPI0022EC794E|nr:gamma-butyrobetaine dioxygenase-like [Anopheles cruzii]
MLLSRAVSSATRLSVNRLATTIKTATTSCDPSSLRHPTNHVARRTIVSSGTVREAPSNPLSSPKVGAKSTTNLEDSPDRRGGVSRTVPGSRPSLVISEAHVTEDRSRVLLEVVLPPGDTLDPLVDRFEYPAVWLRDNCQCEACFHGGSSSRVLDWQTFDVDRVRVATAQPVDGGQSLEIVWSTGHRSVFNTAWLLERSFRPEDTEAYLEEWYRPPPVLWGATEFGTVMQEFAFADVLHEDDALRQWIEALIRYGVVMIKGAPLTEHECRRLANRVGFIRKTHYGEEFIVKAKEGTSNVAYLSTPLQMHTDLPYYDYKPGCNLLHCLVQSTDTTGGGANLIADGFFVTDRLRREHPDAFRLLSETLVNWSDVGQDEGGHFHSIYRAPVICVGRDGRLERINHSVPQRDSHFCGASLDHVDRWYRAMQRFVTVLHQEAVQFRTAPGDILTFSNVRAVHGRTGYTDTAHRSRHIVGAYLDWDEIYSKLRVLKAAAAK